MSCEEIRELLPSYVAGDLGDEAQAVAGHLAACETCAAEEASLRQLVGDLRQAGDAFRPRLLPPELTLARAATQARRRRVTLFAFAGAAAVLAATVVALALPGSARHLPLPAGQRLRQLDDQVAALDAKAGSLTGELSRVSAELALRREAGRAVILRTTNVTPRREALVLRSVAVFFTARSGLALPGAAGERARTRLIWVTVPGSAAANVTAPLPFANASASIGAVRLTQRGTVVVVSRVRMLAAGRALVYLHAFDYGTRTIPHPAVGGPRTRTYWRESVHRLLVVRSASGRWLIAEDLSSIQPTLTAPAQAASVLATGPSPAASPSGGIEAAQPLASPLATPAPGPTATATSAPPPSPTSSQSP